MYENYTKPARHALRLAEDAAAALGEQRIGTEHLLIGLVDAADGAASILLAEAGVNKERLVSLTERLSTVGNAPAGPVKRDDYSVRAERILKEAEKLSKELGSAETGTEHLLLSILRDRESIATRLLHTMAIDLEKLRSAALIAIGAGDRISDTSGSEESDITPTLDKYSRDLTKLAGENKLDPVIGREAEIERILRILSRRMKNNPCLIGEPGVGKTAIVEGLAARIVRDEVPPAMRGKRLLMLDLSGMVAGTKYRGEFEERIKTVVEEASQSRNVLLFIDELHTIIGAGGAEGALDASNILKPSLSRGEIQVIGATTIDEYRKHIEKDAALERRFQPVMVEEPTREEAIRILEGLRPYYESFHGVKILDEAIEAAVDLSERYINDRRLPDKALDLIDEASSLIRMGDYRAQDGKEKAGDLRRKLSEEKEEALSAGDIERARALHEEEKKWKEKSRGSRKNAAVPKLDTNTVARIVSESTGVPVTRLTEKESRRMERLSEELHKRIIGQNEAVEAVASAIKRGRVGLRDPRRPIGSFLFLGPTGVGKTELAKAVAETVFGSEEAMIRVDMSEYMEKYSVSKLIGSPPGYVGYEEGGQLSEQVRRHPYSVLLFDEIEKAHPDVFNILLQVLDEGHITDAHGHKVDFKNTCIIMSSNAGAQAIVEPKHLGFSAGRDSKKEYEAMKAGVMEEVRRIFRPEFINRIDSVIVFHPLSKEDVKAITELLFGQLKKRVAGQMDIALTLTASARDYIAEKGFSEKYGARPLRRMIQEKIEDELAEMVLSGKLKRGGAVQVKRGKDGELQFSVKKEMKTKSGKA